MFLQRMRRLHRQRIQLHHRVFAVSGVVHQKLPTIGQLHRTGQRIVDRHKYRQAPGHADHLTHYFRAVSAGVFRILQANPNRLAGKQFQLNNSAPFAHILQRVGMQLHMAKPLGDFPFG